MSNVPMYSPVGNHVQGSTFTSAAVGTIAVPPTANAVLIQTNSQNIRLTLAGPVSGVAGFRIAAGADPVLIPVGSSTIQIQQEAATAVVEYQFVRVHGGL